MNKEKKKQYFTMFVLLMFLGSGFAYAITLLPGQQNQQKPLSTIYFDRPLSTSEEDPYLYSNIVAVKLLYGPNCGECDAVRETLLSLQKKMNNRFIIENIDIESYGGEANRLNVTEVPTVYVKGAGDAFLTGYQTESDLTFLICSRYFVAIGECSL